MPSRNTPCVALCATMLLSASAAWSAPHWTIQASGGAAVPTGDFGSADRLDARAGFQYGGSIGYRWSDSWGFGIDGSWSRNRRGAEGESIDLGGGDTYALDEDRFETIQLGAHVKRFLPWTGVNPYVLGGLGIYKTTEEWKETITTGGIAVTGKGEETTDTRFGGRVGLGASWNPHEKWSLGAEGDYNLITKTEDSFGGASLSYLAFRGTLTLHILPK